MYPFDSQRSSVDQDEEESAGLLQSYHSTTGESYPPPPSPPTPGSPFLKPSARRLLSCTSRPFLFLSIFLFLSVFFAVSAFNSVAPLYQRLQHSNGVLRAKMRELPQVELDKAKILTEESRMPQGDYSVTAIVLHGLGQPNNEPPFVRKLAAKFPFVRWVSPTADQLNVTVRGFQPTHAWFNIESFDDLSQGENLDEFVHSQQQLNKLVDDERDKMEADGKEPRIALMGFSQGAVMTLLALLSANETDRFEGGIVLSGYVPLLEDLGDIVSRASRDIPLFWGHGKQDPYLTIDQARAGSSLLRSSKIGLRKLTYREYEGLDHIWNEEELDDMADWFQRNIPRKRIGRRPSFAVSNIPTASSSPSLGTVASSAVPPSSQDISSWEQVQQLEDAAEAKARRSLQRRQQSLRGVA